MPQASYGYQLQQVIAAEKRLQADPAELQVMAVYRARAAVYDAKLADIPYDDIYYLALRADLNPVSKETLTEVRRWLSQSSGGIDRGGVFFGSFVSAFVNPKIAPADRVLRVRSQPFYRPKP